MYRYIPSETAYFSEIYQDSDLKFSSVSISNRVVTQLHDFVKCRDFLNDTLAASRQKKKSKLIYGFTFDGSDTPINLKRTELVLKGSDFTLLKSQLYLLNELERSLGARPTVLRNLKGQKDKYLLLASPFWLRALPVYSFYTHILRCLYQYKKAEGCETFQDFLESCANKTGIAATYQYVINKVDFYTLLMKARSIFRLKDWVHVDGVDTGSIYKIHDRGGIVSFVRDATHLKKHKVLEDEPPHEVAAERFSKMMP
jgi:hypothetical protein